LATLAGFAATGFFATGFFATGFFATGFFATGFFVTGFFVTSAFFADAGDFFAAADFALPPSALLFATGLAALLAAARGFLDLAVGFFADLLAVADFAVAIL